MHKKLYPGGDNLHRVPLVVLLMLVCAIGAPLHFRHPGIFSSQMDLEFIRDFLNSGKTGPMADGYAALSASRFSNLNYTPTPFANVKTVASGGSAEEWAFRNDAHAAYAHALRWIKTSDGRYKDKAIQILNVWAATLQEITCATAPRQPVLEASWAMPIWIAAAEIIRHYDNGSAGWPAHEVAVFQDRFVGTVLRHVNDEPWSAPNWKISRALSQMCAAIFIEDRELYDTGYAEIVRQIASIPPDGTPPENTRDYIHSQYVVIGLIQSAEVAFQQGDVGLYMQTDNTTAAPLLARMLEYYVSELMGIGGEMNYSSNNKKCQPYEMGLTRYKYYLDIALPLTQRFVTTYNRPVATGDDHFAGFTTLTHAEMNYPLPGLRMVRPAAALFRESGFDEIRIYSPDGRVVASRLLHQGGNNLFEDHATALQRQLPAGLYVLQALRNGRTVQAMPSCRVPGRQN